MILLSQAQSDRTILAKQLGISEHQLSIEQQPLAGIAVCDIGKLMLGRCV